MIDDLHRIDSEITARMTDLVDLRRHLHRNPELSRKEFKTTALLRERYTHLGFDVRVRSQGTGALAELTPHGFDPKKHPTVALRTDLDALPIAEENEVDYRSQNDGVMHACGHDVHMTCAFGAAQALAAIDHLPGRIRVLLQHAEEIAPSGAADMIAFGALDGVDAILGLHCDPQLPEGVIGVREGALTASFDRFIFKVKGVSGHGARPHHTIDPIFAGVQLANALYSAVSRRFDAREPMVISIGEFRGGAVPNAIPDLVTMTGTVRTVSKDRRQHVRPLLEQLAAGVAATTGATIELDLYEGAPPILNNAALVGEFAEAARAILGDEGVYEIPLPSMGSEDFSNFLDHAPGAMFRLGTAKAGRDVHLLHTPLFDVDERAIAHGSKVLARAALRVLHKLADDRDALR